MKRPSLRRVDDLGHVLAGEVEDVRVVVRVEEGSTSAAKASCSGEKSKSIPAPRGRPPAKSDGSSDLGRRPSAVEVGRPSGDDATVAQAGDHVRVEPELPGEDRGGVLADPGDPRLWSLGDLRELHRVAGDEHRPSTPSVRGISTSMWRFAMCSSAITTPGACCIGPAAMPAAVSCPRRFELGALRRPGVDRGSDHRPPGAGPPSPRGSRQSAGRCPTRGDRARRSCLEPRELRSAALDLGDDVAVGAAEPLAGWHLEGLVGFGPHPRDRSSVTTSVIATVASSMADVGPTGPHRSASRWRSAARMPITAKSPE